ncbi:DNA polymerase IV [Halanaerobium hydrogeniformans]|uniref:DNA polymerase IV n=1 Tax=Halanaerobium hydrogeniformans TaxID=656519 RepID=E4RIG9_HALHG|nr:DNA polymerase IV [Halanaerobium hydrogeniformans]ADQ15039.1 DNA-directed DNA polymerase [Halanaerobium hydrogeniformans]
MDELRVIHADMDAFFAAVEMRENPDMKGKAVIIGGKSLSNRGVVSTASYKAREYGIHSAMPIAQAKKLCPDGIYLPARHTLYKQVSKEVFFILNKYTPLIEKISIDEAFLDIKGCQRLYGSPLKIAKTIKKDVKDTTDLTISIGLSVNKFLAKLASDFEKPDGLTVIEAAEIKKIMAGLDIKKIWGIGDSFAKKLNELGIKKVKDIWPYSLEELKNRFGKAGVKIFYLSRGIDNREVESQSEIKSISHEETFAENIEDSEQLLAYLLKMSEKISFRLHSNSLSGNTVFIKVRYADFKTLNRQKSFKFSLDSTKNIYKIAQELIDKDDLFDKPVRLLGIGVSNLHDSQQKQLNLFEKENDNLDDTIDDIKRKFGFDKISRARKLYLKNDE